MADLRDVPGVSGAVVAAQGKSLEVREPIRIDHDADLCSFEVEVYRASKQPQILAFQGPGSDLESLRREIDFVEASGVLDTIGRVPANVAWGGFEAIVSILEGLWQLLSSPIESAKGVYALSVEIVAWAANTSASEKWDTIERLGDAMWQEYKCEAAESHDLNYFELKTPEAKFLIATEAASVMTGRVAAEALLILVPFDEITKGGTVAKVGTTTSKRASGAGTATRAASGSGVITETADELQAARLGKLFPLTAKQQRKAATQRPVTVSLKSESPRPKSLKLGKAKTTDYRRTFFDKYPKLKGEVEIHHAVPQGILDRYPGLFTPQEIHSLENLRGVPNDVAFELNRSWLNKEWNAFYKKYPTTQPTKDDVLSFASAMDSKYGHLFNPPVR